MSSSSVMNADRFRSLRPSVRRRSHSRPRFQDLEDRCHGMEVALYALANYKPPLRRCRAARRLGPDRDGSREDVEPVFAQTAEGARRVFCLRATLLAMTLRPGRWRRRTADSVLSALLPARTGCSSGKFDSALGQKPGVIGEKRVPHCRSSASFCGLTDKTRRRALRR